MAAKHAGDDHDQESRVEASGRVGTQLTEPNFSSSPVCKRVCKFFHLDPIHQVDQYEVPEDAAPNRVSGNVVAKSTKYDEIHSQVTI
jgi:hypothetical protein